MRYVLFKLNSFLITFKRYALYFYLIVVGKIKFVIIFFTISGKTSIVKYSYVGNYGT